MTDSETRARPAVPSYPLSDGPLEQIYQRAATGELRIDLALQMAISPQVTRELSPDYAHAFGFHAARNATRGRWREGLLQHQLLLAAARAATGPTARRARIHAEREGLVTVTEVLMKVAHGPAYRHILVGGHWLLETLDPVGERELLSECLYYLGTLHLDPYTSYRTVENYDIEHRMWLSRSVDEFGSSMIEGIPAPLDAVRIAERFLTQALPIASGEYRTYAQKALVQAMGWVRNLGRTAATDDERTLRAAALAEIDPLRNPDRWLQVALSVQRSGLAIDPDKLRALVAVPVAEWVRREGPLLAREIVGPMLALEAEYDPLAGLEIARQAASLFGAGTPEDERLRFFERVVSLLERVAEGSGCDLAKWRESAKAVVNGKLDPTTKAACLVGLANRSRADDQETVGLELLSRAEAMAPRLTELYAGTLRYLGAMLWLGAASNAMHGDPPRPGAGAQAYGMALGLCIDAGLERYSLELVQRLEAIARVRELEGSTSVLSVLTQHAFRIELVTGEPGAGILRAIYSHLTVVFARDFVKQLFAVWQLAKGCRFGAILTEGIGSLPGGDPKMQRILRQAIDARAGLSADELDQGRSSGGADRFDSWLTSFIEGSRFDGDRPWERFANLKMTFDENVANFIAPAVTDSNANSLELAEIQARLGDHGVLLVVYEGMDMRGDPTTHWLLVTSEDVRHRCHSHPFVEQEVIWQDGERHASQSALGRQVADLRRALVDDPADAVATPAALEQLANALSIRFAGLESELAQLGEAGKSHLIVVPHEALHVAPFHLFGSSSPLADRWTITYLPQLALLSDARAERHQSSGHSNRAAIGLGFARAEGGWAPLPEAVAEARAISAILGVPPLLNERATKPAVMAALQQSKSVHLGSHGAMDVDSPVFQFLVLHPAHDEDAGRLYAHEILDLPLGGLQLVTLSACETALGRIDRSDNVRGMSAALFAAGVQTVIGTLWPVESNTSAAFFVSLYRALNAGQVCGKAFRTAQLETRTRFPAYRDWGAFYLAGAWS